MKHFYTLHCAFVSKGLETHFVRLAKNPTNVLLEQNLFVVRDWLS